MVVVTQRLLTKDKKKMPICCLTTSRTQPKVEMKKKLQLNASFILIRVRTQKDEFRKYEQWHRVCLRVQRAPFLLERLIEDL